MSANTNGVSHGLSIFERCNQNAERNKAAKWEAIAQERDLCIVHQNGRRVFKTPGRDWWQDKALWDDKSPPFSTTEAAAIENIFHACGGYARTTWQVMVSPEYIREETPHQDKLVDLLARRGVTLEWVALNPGDIHLMVFEVPLSRAA